MKYRDVIIEQKLVPPSSFLFPFTPYENQHDFMTTLYSALEDKKIGIFESPTGTVNFVYILQL
jgi:chromosome transmission fidelity protein 1